MPVLLKGIGIPLQLIFVGAVLGVALGTACAWARALGPVWLKPVVAGYVELIRNTPFLIQLFFIFFGLPSLGVQMSELTAANLAMIVNLGAYSCEIVRAGIQATPRGQFEAGASLAMAPSLVSFAGGGIVGVALLFLRIGGGRVARLFAKGYTELFQGTPLLMQL